MSCLRANPMTGEMIDGDVIFDASWIRDWKEEYAFLIGMPIPRAQAARRRNSRCDRHAAGVGEIISPIMAAKQGYGLPAVARRERCAPPRTRRACASTSTTFCRSWSPRAGARSRCMTASALGRGTMAAASTRIARSARCSASPPWPWLQADADKDKDGEDKGDKDKDDKEGKDKDKDADKKDSIELPDEFIGQAIKEVVMHEVGHSLGLRHNFKASTMLDADQLNDTSITPVKGMTGSVMDYNPINIAPKGQKQGDYATTTIGPYDYWAIEYAYKPIDGDEASELKKIAARSPEPTSSTRPTKTCG